MDDMDLVQAGREAPESETLLSEPRSPEDEVGEVCATLTEKDIRTVEAILQSGKIDYAYLYPCGRANPEVFVFSQTPENMANFIGQQLGQDSELTLTDRMDMTVLTAFGGFIDKCPDKKVLQSVLQHLVPIQMGQISPREVPAVSLDMMDRYNEMMAYADMGMEM